MVQSKKSKNIFQSAIRRAARRHAVLKNFKILTKEEWEAQAKPGTYEEYVDRKMKEKNALEAKQRNYL